MIGRFRSVDPASLFYVPPDLADSYDAELRPDTAVLAAVDVSDDDVSAAWFAERSPSRGRVLDPWNWSRIAAELREHRAVLAIVRDRRAAPAPARSSWWHR